MKRPIVLQAPVERILPWLVLAVLLIYTYAGFCLAPYTGFDFNPGDGEVLELFVPSATGPALHEGDLLRQLGAVSWAAYKSDGRQPLFEDTHPGQVIPLRVLRGAEEIALAWRLPGANRFEIIDRLVNVWILAYIFWLAGTGVYLFLRPKDSRWRLPIAASYLTALWLITGQISKWHILEAPIFTRMIIWLFLPVLFHLHWIFPRPLGKLPRPLLVPGYLAAAFLACLELFQLLPRPSYYLGFLGAVLGSAVLLAVHYIRQPAQRRALNLVFIAVGLTGLPLVGLSLAGLMGALAPNTAGGLLAIPLIPIAYAYAIYSRQLGGLEMRANRLISLFIFFVLLGTSALVLLQAANTWLVYPGSTTLNGVLIALLASLVTAGGYPRFKSAVDHNLLGIPLRPERLVETYAARIITSHDLQGLRSLLQKEILPTLQISQYALVRCDDSGAVVSITSQNVPAAQLPIRADIPYLLEQAGRYRVPAPQNEPPRPFPWVRLVVPVRLQGRLIGLALFGRRDPDDFYAQSELPFFQTLANQTAIALANIAQAAQIRTIYQTNVERYEQERVRLARDLHDDVLNPLVALGMYADLTVAPRFSEDYRKLIGHLREAINGLRPPILNYGLRTALEDLVDEFDDRQARTETLIFDLPPSEARYDPNVEHQLYRIVQQALENALQHAQAQTIRLGGALEPEGVRLEIQDDGIGLQRGERLDITRLLDEGHFGLVGMLERASLIGAGVDLHSIPGQGTTVNITWSGNSETTRL